MQRKYLVRWMQFDSSDGHEALGESWGVARSVLSRSTRALRESGEFAWSIRHVEAALTSDNVYVLVSVGHRREVTTDDGTTLMRRELREHDGVGVWILFGRRLMLVEDPKPSTRDITSSELALVALDLIRRFLIAEGGMPSFELVSPEGKRSKQWFVDRLLEVAASEDERVVDIAIRNLHGSILSEEFPVFNPDADWEKIGRQFMPRANDQVRRSTHSAVKGGDLSHNPMVRAQLGAGTPESMTIAHGAGRSERKHVFKEERTDRLSIRAAISATLKQVLERINEVLDSGEYEVD